MGRTFSSLRNSRNHRSPVARRGGQPQPAPAKPRRPFSLLEQLENRALFSVITVSSALDDGSAGTLRAAINQANANPGADTIRFNFASGAAPTEIQLRSALPAITDALTIDGTSQPGYGNVPLVWIDGAAAGAGANGLTVNAANVTIKGLSITGFGGAGIDLTGPGGTLVLNNYLGVDPSGTGATGGNLDGVNVESANDALSGNVISNNTYAGVSVTGDAATLAGNMIGVDPTGKVAYGNFVYGVQVVGGRNTVIGGPDASARNVISGNFSDGVYVAAPASNVSVQNNFVGTDVDGGLSLGNNNGVTVFAATPTTTAVSVRDNVISAGFGDGVRLDGASGNTVAGNVIGLDYTGTSSLGNAGNGVNLLDGATGNTIGGAGAGDGNVISANLGDGVAVDAASAGNTVSNNFIGVDAAGSVAQGNSSNGVNAAAATTIAGNLIAGNAGYGVWVKGGSTVTGNSIGLAANGVSALANGDDGVHVEGNDNAIGGLGAGAGNVIAFNAGAGVNVASGTGNAIHGNSIYANALGIDLGGDGVTPNDSQGHAGGPNLYQNFPTLTSWTAVGSAVTFAGRIDGATAGGTYVLDFYSDPAADPTQHGQGKTWLGAVTVTTSATGAFTATVNMTNGDTVVSATATDAAGNTSEFSADFTLSAGNHGTGSSSVVGTTETLTASANPAFYGQNVTFTAQLAPASGTALPVGEQVTFKQGNNVLGTGTIDANGVATFTTTFAVGTYPITAVYGGDAGFTASTSNEVDLVVNPLVTATTISSSNNPARVGTFVTFNASAALSGGGTISSGSIRFVEDGTTVLGTFPVDAAGHASFGLSTLALGTHTITAQYLGNAAYATSSATLTENVVAMPTTTTLASSLNPATYGQGVTLDALVSPASGTAVPFNDVVTFMDGTNVLGTALVDSTGHARLALSTLPVGTHPITAVFGGDPAFAASTSAELDETINPIVTTTTLTSTANPSTYGQGVTFTALVTPASGAEPVGELVTFLDGATVLGTGTIDATGHATFTTTALAVGSHSITAAYSADATRAGSASAPLGETVNPIVTTTTITSSLNPATFGQNVTFTALVTPASGTLLPVGQTITFMDGAGVLGTGTVDATGHASFSTGGLAVGGHAITAVYGGDSVFVASTSAALGETVNKIVTSTMVASSVNPDTFGQGVTFTATVTPASGSTEPVGETVLFEDGSTVIGTGTVDASGHAAFTTSGLSVGSHAITAVYGGDATLTGSNSAALGETVNPIATSTALTASANPVDYGQGVTFTAQVSPATGTLLPVGDLVTFMDGGAVLGTGTVDATGRATFTTASLGVGTHAVTAVMAGDADFTPSTSNEVDETVNKLATATTLASSANPSTYGQGVTFTALVTPASGAVPTGELVTFSDGGTVLGTTAIDATGHTSFTLSSLTVGAHAITASYGGDATHLASASAALSETINPIVTTTTLTSSANPSVYGQNVTFTALVTPASGAPLPTGEAVTFMDGSNVLGTGTVDATGHASFSTAALTVGSHSVTAVYGGDAVFTASTSAALGETITKIATSTSVTASANPSTYGQGVTLTALVTPASGSTAPVGEMVTFMDGSTVLGTAAVDATGHASLSTAALSVGAHSITASYGGDATLAASASPALAETVNPIVTSTTLSSSLNPATYGQSVTFTALVSPASGALLPAGDVVTFQDGNTVLGTGTVDATGRATFSTSALGVGGHSITAVFGGDTDFTASTSAALGETVNKIATTTTVTSSLNPDTYGQSVTFTALVTPASGSVVAGEAVTFLDGSTVIGTGTLDAAGHATLTTSALGVGSHGIVASYAGDATLAASASPALGEAVNAIATSTTVASSLNPASYGQSVTFTALVSPATGSLLPVGDLVTFKDGSAVLGTGTIDGTGHASFSTSALGVGGHSITAVFGGDANFAASTSGALNETVNPLATSTAIVSSVNPSLQGSTVTFTATVSSASGTPSGAVEFIEDGSTVLATITATNGVASYGLSTLTLGGHSIQALYMGNGIFASSSAALTQTVIAPASIAGYEYLDANNNGVKDAGEAGIAGSTIKLTGTNDLGQSVGLTTTTAADGSYAFTGLRPSNATGYTITETLPAGYLRGTDSVGTAGGVAGAGVFSSVAIAAGTNAANYNFADFTDHLAGTAYVDQTGNGMSADDTPMAGVTVNVYKDANGNGVYSPSADGAPVATVVTAADGTYSLSNLAPGNYLVKETVPTGYVRTVPNFADYYAVAVAGGSNIGHLDFDNFQKCAGQVTNVTYKDNGVCIPGLRGYTHQGDTITVTFTVPAGTPTDQYTLVSYDAPGATFDASTASQQTIYQVDTETFGPGTHTLTVKTPTNYYQVDFVTCEAIDTFGPAGSNVFYSAQGRLIDADNAGTHSDVDSESATMHFWANLGQSLINGFNGGSHDTALGNWLAQAMPNVYGKGGHNTAGLTNAQVATMYKNFYNVYGQKNDAQVMATALNVYASTTTLGGAAATAYGFSVTDAGLGAASFNVGSNGAAFGVANNSTRTVNQLLAAINAYSSNDVLYNGNSSMLNQCYSMLGTINTAGGIN